MHPVGCYPRCQPGFDNLRRVGSPEATESVETLTEVDVVYQNLAHNILQDARGDFICLLGCTDCPDSFSHYVRCPYLFALTKFFKRDTSNDPLTRLSLVSPSAVSMLCVSCMFTGYHAVKNEVRCGNLNPIINDASNVRRLLWTTYAHSFWSVAVEVWPNIPSFSAPKFIRFLIESNAMKSIADTNIH